MTKHLFSFLCSCLLTSLRWHPLFNHPLPCLPLSPTHLYFGNDFNQPVDNLSFCLKHLEFGGNFNHPVDPPSGLTHLSLDVTHLTLQRLLNNPADHLPPSSLSCASAASSCIHKSATRLVVITQDNLPSSRTILEIISHKQLINKHPYSLTSMNIYNYAGIPDINLSIPVWPPASQQLMMKSFTPHRYNNLPNTIEDLTIEVIQ